MQLPGLARPDPPTSPTPTATSPPTNSNAHNPPTTPTPPAPDTADLSSSTDDDASTRSDHKADHKATSQSPSVRRPAAIEREGERGLDGGVDVICELGLVLAEQPARLQVPWTQKIQEQQRGSERSAWCRGGALTAADLQHVSEHAFIHQLHLRA
eukprot:3631318-Rhodomonas_salina.1